LEQSRLISDAILTDDYTKARNLIKELRSYAEREGIEVPLQEYNELMKSLKKCERADGKLW
jgi:hypothetical protein